MTRKEEEQEAMPRRRFMRQSAEVAALSLFGVLGLDAVIEAVTRRIQERQRIGVLADRVAEDVRRNGAAYADPHCAD